MERKATLKWKNSAAESDLIEAWCLLPALVEVWGVRKDPEKRQVSDSSTDICMHR